MAPLGKERASSPTPSTTTVGTSGTATQAAAIAKTPTPKVSKPEPFYRSRQKFKAFCTQVRLGIWADNRRPVEKRIIRYDNAQVLWAASFLRGDVYLRMEPYITARLEITSTVSRTVRPKEGRKITDMR
jgi:hypothetical protein